MVRNVIKLLTEYRLLLAIILVWSVVLYLSFITNSQNIQDHSIRIATHQARDYWNKDSAFREWATKHGGVYVPVDERTPPNPLLAHLPHRDEVTSDGIKLTLMNPAYMMRQMTKEFGDNYGVRGKITGQILLDPNGIINKADEWELKSLKKFDQGIEEVIEITSIENEPYLRFMKPMLMVPGCESCHGHLGFKTGDIRGGVSVSVPLTPFQLTNKLSQEQTFLSHFIIWLTGLIVGFYFEFIKRKQAKRNRQTVEILNRSEKMNTLGKLTSGIAHDYNNMLGVIIGYSEMLELELKNEPKLGKYAKEIHAAGARGAKLTRKLLSFSKNKRSEVSIVNINNILLEQQHLLEKTITANFELAYELSNDLWNVSIDISDFIDVIINMAINGMHAMDKSGQLTITTSNYKINRTDEKILGIKQGEYIRLTIADTGCGMDEITRSKIFDPFYTTKGEKGTGLGLSQVYGFIQRNNGSIKVYSELDNGTQFSIYLPRDIGDVKEAALEKEVKSEDNKNVRGNEKILVVDDEVSLLNLAQDTLVQYGYTIFCAKSGDEALDILAHETIDLMISDIIMPNMNGFQLSSIVQKQYPAVKIQLASGFSDDRYRDLVGNNIQNNILLKPFKTEALLEKIRYLLDHTNTEQQFEDMTFVPKNSLKHFEWNKDLVIGIPEVDKDHKVLVTLLNRSISAFNHNKQNDKEFSDIINQLIDYTKFHFAKEELIMEVCKYADIEAHKKEHLSLLNEVGHLSEELKSNVLTAKLLVQLLADWLKNHILISDKSIAPYYFGNEKIIKEALLKYKHP